MEKDLRIPVYIGGLPGPDDAVLVEDGQTMPESGYALRFSVPRFGHQPGCFCCSSRGPAANAFSALYRARATGTGPYFSRVLVLGTLLGIADVKAALQQDAVTQARFRLAEPG